MGFYDLKQDAPGVPFGFRVLRPGTAPIYGENWALGLPDDCWALGLPHQCDDWAIGMSTDRETVLAEARRFRAELDEAIAVLEAG